jgi:DnaJ-class molecular chaperone
MEEPKDLYLVLEISRGATQTEIKSAYRALVLRWHPDRNNGEHYDRFIDIQRAYEILSDPEKKKMYDKYGVMEDFSEEELNANLKAFNKKFEEEFGVAPLDEDLEKSRDRNLFDAGKMCGYNMRECSDCKGTGITVREIGFFIKKEKCKMCGGRGFVELPPSPPKIFSGYEQNNDFYKKGGLFSW